MSAGERRRAGALANGMARASAERHRRIRDHQVARILELLREDILTTNAALSLDSADGIYLECPFAKEVWTDYRVQQRLRLLAAHRVQVELHTHTTEVNRRQFERTQIIVRYR